MAIISREAVLRCICCALVIGGASFLAGIAYADNTQFESPIPKPVIQIPGLLEFVPTPDGGQVPLHLSGQVVAKEVRDGLYYATEGIYQAMFLVDKRGVILVDAPPSLVGLLDVIADVTDKPIRVLIYSHEHKDHIGGAQAVVDKFPRVRIYAHLETSKLIRAAHKRDPDDPRPKPTHIVRKNKRVWVGGQYVSLSYQGTAHSPGDLFIYAPRQKTLMVVDVVFPGWVPFSNLAISKNVFGFIDAHDKILEFDFDTFIGGHLTRIGNRDDVIRSKEYVLAIQAAASAALNPSAPDDGNPDTPVNFGDLTDQENVPEPFNFNSPPTFLFFQNPWALSDEYLKDVVKECTDSILGGNFGNFDDLAAVDVFTDSHCYAMQSALRVD